MSWLLERFVEKEKTWLWSVALASFLFSTNTALERYFVSLIRCLWHQLVNKELVNLKPLSVLIALGFPLSFTIRSNKSVICIAPIERPISIQTASRL